MMATKDAAGIAGTLPGSGFSRTFYLSNLKIWGVLKAWINNAMREFHY